LKFEYSDLRANYPTHGMLTPSKIYAVKTRHPHSSDPLSAGPETTPSPGRSQTEIQR
jgi:hypothetical protein